MRKRFIATAATLLGASAMALAAAAVPAQAAGASKVHGNSNWNGYVRAPRQARSGSSNRA